MAQADEYFWLLSEFTPSINRSNDDEPDSRRRTVWKSYAQATAIKTDPSYPIFIQDRDALASKPVFEVHVAFSGNPQRVLEAPVTEVDLSRVDDTEVNPDARPAAETQELIRRITYRVESLQMQGFIALSWGVALEDGTRGVYLGGWKTIEVRSFARSLTLSLVLSFVTLSLPLTGPHAFGHIGRTQSFCGRD